VSARTRANKRSKRAALEAARQLNEPGWSAIRVGREAVAARDATASALADEETWKGCFAAGVRGMWSEMEREVPTGLGGTLTRLGVHHGLLADPKLSVEDNVAKFLAAFRSQAVDLCRLADVHVVSPEMHDLVQAAADTLEGPDLTTLIRDDILVEHGILWLPEPMQLEGALPARALAWQLRHFIDSLPCLVITAWATSEQPSCDAPGPLTEAWAAPLFLAGSQQSPGEEGEWTYPDHLGIARYMFAYIRLSAQRIIVTPRLRDQIPPGSTKSRRPADVRVIRLRSFKSASRGLTGHCPVNWTHRWVVKMHKTHQWYPSLGIHRVIFRGPFFKGPEDAPLLTGEKVSALVR
jgi:hypothetical protein